MSRGDRRMADVIEDVSRAIRKSSDSLPEARIEALRELHSSVSLARGAYDMLLRHGRITKDPGYRRLAGALETALAEVLTTLNLAAPGGLQVTRGHEVPVR